MSDLDNYFERKGIYICGRLDALDELLNSSLPMSYKITLERRKKEFELMYKDLQKLQKIKKELENGKEIYNRP